MKKESFREDLEDVEWPREVHEPILGHSIPLGQFALLVKKDPGGSSLVCPQLEQKREGLNGESTRQEHGKTKKARFNPAQQTTDWCPPGTSTVWSGQGCIHTCSDKICRWNCLGLQGSLLASRLEKPLYMSSLTVGRKLTSCICRRAVCCRAAAGKSKAGKKKKAVKEEEKRSGDTGYKINHPAIMGTAVYMDEGGVIEAEDVRFHSALSWAWWPSIAHDASTHNKQIGNLDIECIDGSTGFAILNNQLQSASLSNTNGEQVESRVCTSSLVRLYSKVTARLQTKSNKASANAEGSTQALTLAGLREFKQQASPHHESQKGRLFSKHPLFRQWKRRQQLDGQTLR